MKVPLLVLVAALLAQGIVSVAQAQTPAAVAAARAPNISEGNTIPESKPKVSPAERDAARAARKVEGAKAAREVKPGEGNPIPEARAKVSPQERTAARAARRVEATRAQKDGKIKASDEATY